MSEGNIKFKTLLDRLYESTINSRIDWKLTTKENPFCMLGDFTITLTSGVDPEGEPLEYVTIGDLSGKLVEHFTDNDLSLFKPNERDQNFHNYWKLMENLRLMAVRQAKGADKAIDEILSALDDIDIPF